MPFSDPDVAPIPFTSPSPIAVQSPSSPAVTPPRALLVQVGEGSGKSSRVKGMRWELRNLEIEMSFGKKEAGFLPGNQ